jgi:tetratricopeptide (TPR) repeat protein
MTLKVHQKTKPHPKNCWACKQAKIIRLAFGFGRYRIADKLVNQLLKKFPEDYEGNRLKSEIAASLERFQEALKFASRTIRLDPVDPDGPAAKSYVYSQMERWKDSANWAKRSITLFRKNPKKWRRFNDLGSLYVDLASALVAQGKKVEGLRTFRQVLRVSKNRWVRSLAKNDIKHLS